MEAFYPCKRYLNGINNRTQLAANIVQRENWKKFVIFCLSNIIAEKKRGEIHIKERWIIR